MADFEGVLAQLYQSFNSRNIEDALQWMTEDVRWPKASEGGTVVGKAEIRAYWTRQWSEFDPHVTPLAMDEEADGRVRVRVQQVVKSLAGKLLSDTEVQHVYTLHAARIAAMELGGAGSSKDPSAAFSHASGSGQR